MNDIGLTEDIICETLVANRGDLVLTAEDLGLTPSKMLRFIRSVPRINATYAAIGEIKDEFKSQDALARAIQEHTAAYKLDGLVVIHEIATTPHRNAAEAEVRLKAAVQLRGNAEHGEAGGSAVLEELNEIYHRSSPRIKSLRAVQIEFEAEPSDQP